MAERTFELALLERTASAMQWPDAPDLRARVAAAISAEAPRGARPAAAPSVPAIRRWPVIASFGAAAAAIALLAAIATPGSRDAIADFFGIEGSKVEFLPTPAPGTSPTPLPTPVDIGASATQVTLAEAEAALGFAPSLPDGRQPAEVLLVRYAGQPVVILRYPEYDLWQTKLIAGSSFGKEPVPGGLVEEFLIEGTPARWITGAPHFVFYEQQDGVRFDASERLVEQSTLIWNQHGVFHRLETDLSRDDAVEIARSLR